MVSSLIGPQYHDNQFWKFSEAADEGDANNFDVSVVPSFSSNFEVQQPHFRNLNHKINQCLVCSFPWY